MNAQKNAAITEKSLVGILTASAGLVSCDYVTRHFIPEKRNSRRVFSGGKLYSTEGEVLFPATREEIRKLVYRATQENRKVTIVGANFSQGKQLLPINGSDIVINLKNINRVEIDPDKKRAVVEAGATWRDVQVAANDYRLSVQVMQASNIFSIGGSLSANCHGWDHAAGTVAHTVLSLSIVNAEGSMVTLTPNDELFGLVIAGWGQFGVIVEMELQLTDNLPLIDSGEQVGIEEYVQYFDEHVLPNPNVKMHLYRLSLDPENLL